jgi:hypothetical protein
MLNLSLHGRVRRTVLIAVAITASSFVAIPAASAKGWRTQGDSHATPLAAKVEAGGKFTPVTPVRILDTRIGLGAPKGKPAIGETIRVPVRGQNGVPADATAVLVNVTLAEGISLGGAVVYSCDRLPDLVTVILDGVASANLSTAPIAADGTICFQVSDDTHLVADLAGWYGPSAASGFNPVTPARLLDTRIGLGAPKAQVPANGTLTLQVAGLGGVPTGAKAAALNITATETKGNGYVTAYPCDQPRPTASNLNFAAARTVPNLAVVPLAANGTVCLYSFAAADLLADASGWFGDTGSSFTPISSTEQDDSVVFDSGEDYLLAGNQVVTIKVRGEAGVPDTATSAVLGLFAAAGPQAGYLTAYPCDQPRPTASNLNYRAAVIGAKTIDVDVKAATVMVPIAANGTVCVYTFAPVLLVVNALGVYG